MEAIREPIGNLGARHLLKSLPIQKHSKRLPVVPSAHRNDNPIVLLGCPRAWNEARLASDPSNAVHPSLAGPLLEIMLCQTVGHVCGPLRTNAIGIAVWQAVLRWAGCGELNVGAIAAWVCDQPPEVRGRDGAAAAWAEADGHALGMAWLQVWGLRVAQHRDAELLQHLGISELRHVHVQLSPILALEGVHKVEHEKARRKLCLDLSISQVNDMHSGWVLWLPVHEYVLCLFGCAEQAHGITASGVQDGH
mmetsp:Transcript_25240/g.70605  ORF Transcript_25240/g.70605 Transcript_25240/m.70605 type:complete len:250 (+) Transcript_25240:94-843(+)